MKAIVLLFALSFIGLGASAQRNIQAGQGLKATTLQDAEAQLQQDIHAYLNNQMKPDGALTKYAAETGLTGTYVVDLTFHKKGKVRSVFVVSREGGSVSDQNHFKSALTTLKAPVKLPKNAFHKVRHTFEFSNPK